MPTADPVVTTDDPVVTRVVEEVHPLRVVLFGSRARGTDGPESDVDLLVVMPDGTPRRPTARHLHRHIWNADVSVDYVVTTPSDLARSATTLGLI